MNFTQKCSVIKSFKFQVAFRIKNKSHFFPKANFMIEKKAIRPNIFTQEFEHLTQHLYHLGYPSVNDVVLQNPYIIVLVY